MDDTLLLTLLAAALAMSEAIALIPGIKGSSIFQVIFFVIKALYSTLKKKEVI
jgi:hypothetical protein